VAELLPPLTGDVAVHVWAGRLAVAGASIVVGELGGGEDGCGGAAWCQGRRRCNGAMPRRTTAAVRDGGGSNIGHRIIVVVDDVEPVVLKEDSIARVVLAGVLHSCGWDRSGLWILGVTGVMGGGGGGGYGGGG